MSLGLLGAYNSDSDNVIIIIWYEWMDWRFCKIVTKDMENVQQTYCLFSSNKAMQNL